MRVRDYEVEIPIPPKDDEPDLDFVSDLWWTAIDLIKEYEKKDQYPVRIALEMRLMAGSSGVVMAPQYGNKWTCAIEVLTTMGVDKLEWFNFLTDLT